MLSATASAPTLAAAPVPARRWVEWRGHAMGSSAHVLATTDRLDLLDVVPDRLAELEACWSRFRDDSDLARLDADPRVVVPVAPALAELVHRAVIAWRSTGGYCDASVRDALVTAGYDRPFCPDADPRGRLDACRPAPGLGAVTVDLERSTVSRPPGLRLDLGGVGKGWAADLVATELAARGVTGVCVSLGGDVRVAGLAPDGGWVIPVEHPTEPAASGDPWFEVWLVDGAVVTSTTGIRRWTTDDGHAAHHLIDPATGRPARSGVVAAVVVAAEAWWAEALAKAALVAGPDGGRRLLDEHRATGWLVGDDGEVLR